MKKVAKILKKTLKIILILALTGIFYSFGYSTYENIKVNNDLKTFKERAVYDQTVSLNNGKEDYIRHYYKVSRETYDELHDQRSVFRNEEKIEMGQKGDVFVTRQSPFKNVFFLHQFMTYYYGGHAAIYNGVDGFLESTGYPDSFKELIDVILDDGENEPGYHPTAHLNKSDYWLKRSIHQYEDAYFDYYYRSEVIGLRIKGIMENVDAFVDNANQKYVDQRLYNFLFFLNMKNKYYCTDLVSRAYSEVLYGESNGYAKALNDDGFITSVNDLILTKDTYITFIFEVKKEQDNIVEYLYYLEDI